MAVLPQFTDVDKITGWPAPSSGAATGPYHPGAAGGADPAHFLAGFGLTQKKIRSSF
jgi:hypothetical protein